MVLKKKKIIMQNTQEIVACNILTKVFSKVNGRKSNKFVFFKNVV